MGFLGGDQLQIGLKIPKKQSQAYLHLQGALHLNIPFDVPQRFN